MTDQQPQDQNTTSPAPAGAENTGSDNRIPQERFNQVLQERNALKASMEEMQAQLAKLQEAETKRREADMTELEKAQAKAQEVEQQYQTLQQQLEAERRARLEDRRDSMLAQSLAAAGALDAEDAVTVLKARHADDVAAVMKGDAPDPDAIKALVDKARAERAYLFQSGGPGSPSNKGGAIPAPKSEAAVQMAQFAQQFGYKVDAQKLAERIRTQDQEDNE